MSNKSGGSIELLLGMVIGGVFGAAAGLLLAPQSGKETREQIRSKSEELYKDTRSKAEDYKKKTLDPKVRELEKEFKKKVSELEKKAKKVSKK